MSCVLRAAGRTFDVEKYLARSPFRRLAVHRRGEPVPPATKPNGPKRPRSGCNIEVSGREFADFAGQVRDAIRFLKGNGAAVRRLRRFPGVDAVTLHFGVVWRDVAAQTDAFPEELVALAGKCALGLCISHYPVSRGDVLGLRRGKGNVKAPQNRQLRRTRSAHAVKRRR
jgi:hypothetical protein